MSSYFEIDFVILGRPTASVKLTYMSTSLMEGIISHSIVWSPQAETVSSRISDSFSCSLQRRLGSLEGIYTSNSAIFMNKLLKFIHKENKVNRLMSKFYILF